MLLELLRLLREAPRGLTLLEISRSLQAQPAAVAGMLEWLTQSGRLAAVGPDGGFCNTCGQATDCRLMALHGVRYVVADRQAVAA